MKKVLNILFLITIGFVFPRDYSHALNTIEYSIYNGYRDDTAYINASSFNDWVYFSFETNSVIDIANPSSSLEWDMAFRRNHMKTNSGLSGLGAGGGYVDDSMSWLDNWETLNNAPSDANWQVDSEMCCYYDINDHTFSLSLIKNPALDQWGAFSANQVFEYSNYVMFVKDAEGSEAKFWAYDYYSTGAGGGHISIRYDILNDGGSDGGDNSACTSDDINCINGTIGGIVGSCTCSCDTGYEGSDCSIDIDDCVGIDCGNGTCVDGLNSFSCYCDTGYEGLDCSTSTNDTVDCSGVVNGTAVIDDCGECRQDYCYTYATHAVDFVDALDGSCDGGMGVELFVSAGSDTVYYNSTCTDCADVVNGTAVIDDCGECRQDYCYTYATHAVDFVDALDGSCDGGMGVELFVSAGSDTVYYNSTCTQDCLGVWDGNAVSGDLNSSGVVNVADVVYLVNYILGATTLDVSCGDINDDGDVNVSDVVGMINLILADRLYANIDASESKLIISGDSLRLESNGFVQGIQLTLSHGSKFEIELVDAFVSEYLTEYNQTILIIATDGSDSITDIATYTGDMVVESVHVVNQTGDVAVEQVIEISGVEINVVGPNPFNPSTQLSIAVPEAGFVSVNVYNVLGQKVATLVDGYMDANSAGHVVNFNAEHLASGVYLVQAVSAGDISTQKLMLVK